VTYANDYSCSYLRWTRREECELKGKLIDAEKWRRLIKANIEVEEILEICYMGNEKPIIVPESIEENAKSRLAEAEVFRNYLIALGHLNEDEDAYFCAYEEDCKECAEKDWATCLGYNVKLAAEKAETSPRGKAEG
jgi:hypothetical protein